jgi:hypothetical protein
MAGIDDLTDLFHQFLPSTPPAPTAYTRVTRTPISWGNTQTGGAGEHNRGAITIDPQQLPPGDLNHMQDQSNVIRHESVHDLLPADTVNRIQSYLQSSGQMGTAQNNLREIDPQAAASPQRTASEAPAYAMMGRTLGLDRGAVEQYVNRMPDAVGQKYMRLLGGNAPDTVEQLSQKYAPGEQAPRSELFMRVVANRVQHTARQLGISPQEALQKFMDGEISLAAVK